ncbi:hypothetical protein Gorai_004316, partial [Gossypium raimondii]|nr:hypothetical protein [Gossypium raimondii]
GKPGSTRCGDVVRNHQGNITALSRPPGLLDSNVAEVYAIKTALDIFLLKHIEKSHLHLWIGLTQQWLFVGVNPLNLDCGAYGPGEHHGESLHQLAHHSWSNEIPSTIGNLTTLKHIDLSNNIFTGS